MRLAILVTVLAGACAAPHGARAGLNKGMLIGAVTGLAAGIAIGLVARHDCEIHPETDRDCLAPVVLAPILFGASGVLIGAGVGALVGAVAKEP